MSVANFDILAFVDPIGIVTTPSGMQILRAKGMGVSVRLPADRSQNDPILGPQFPPSVWSIGGPISLPTRSPDLIPGCTLRYKS